MIGDYCYIIAFANSGRRQSYRSGHMVDIRLNFWYAGNNIVMSITIQWVCSHKPTLVITYYTYRRVFLAKVELSIYISKIRYRSRTWPWYHFWNHLGKIRGLRLKYNSFQYKHYFYMIIIQLLSLFYCYSQFVVKSFI